MYAQIYHNYIYFQLKIGFEKDLSKIKEYADRCKAYNILIYDLNLSEYYLNYYKENYANIYAEVSAEYKK